MSQEIAFWAMCLYLVVEYVRPQQLFPALFGMPLGQITLGLALVAKLSSGRGFDFRSPATWLFLTLTAIIVASSIAGYDPDASFFEIKEVWLGWVVIYLLIVSVVNTEQRFVFFIVLWMLCHYYMSQGGARQFAGRGFRFATWGITGQPGWFGNSGEFGIAMCMFAAVSWHFFAASRNYLTLWRKVFVLGMPITAVLGVIGSSSRGAVLGLGGIGFWAVLRSKHRTRTILSVIAVSVVVWMVVPPEQKSRFDAAGEDRTSTLRIIYWKAGLDMGRNHPLLGIGYGNWIKYYGRFYSQMSDGVVQVPHNIFIQAIAELGYSGLVVFVALIAASLVISRHTREIARSGPAPPSDFLIQMTYGLDGALISYVVAGFFVTVLYYPFFWVTLALTVALNGIARQRMSDLVKAPVVLHRRGEARQRLSVRTS